MKYDIGNKIKYLRKKNGCSQSELSKYLEVGTQAVSKWERGVCAPDIDLLPDIATFFCVGIDELFCSEHYDDCRKALAELELFAEHGEWGKVVDKSIEYIRVFPYECSICEYMLYGIIREEMCGGEIPETIFLRAVNLAKRALPKCTDDNLKQKITYHLCSILYMKGRNDEADYYCETMNSAIFSRENVHAFKYYGKEKQRKLRENLAVWYSLLGKTFVELAYNVKPSEESVDLLRKAVESYNLSNEYAEDKGNLRACALILLDIAITYAVMENLIEAEKSFEKARDFCKRNGIDIYFTEVTRKAVKNPSFSNAGKELYRKMGVKDD